MAVNIDTKFDRKLACKFKNDKRNLADSFQNTRKSQNLDFDEIPLSQEEINYRGVIILMTMKNDLKFEEELTCQFKIEMRNLTSFHLKNVCFNELPVTKL